ncbi:Ig-like domain-containing protein [Microbacterium rhizophilus]|uniref:Ig-like domain-containing protein n=1 Tax=Microbacterium rhizophilus TaxID=3138934 RepID=UPI0031EC0B95
MVSWLHVRPRTLVGAAIVTVAAVGITTMAVAYEGNPTTELDLHDGSVWITKANARLVGHFNAESRVLDGQLLAGGADYDVLQDGARVLVADATESTVGSVDVAAMAVGDSVQVPADAVVDYAASTVAILDPEKGALYVVPFGGLASFNAGETKPVLDKLGENAAVTVGRDGKAHVASPARGAVFTVPVTAEGEPDTKAIAEQRLEDVAEDATVQVTAVGERPVVLDEDTGSVTVAGSPTVAIDEPEDARLALDAADGEAVLVATRTELLSIPLDGAEPTATTAGGSGLPTAPVWLNGCAYAAWDESGRFLRDCVGAASDLPPAQISEYEADGGPLRFRVNRDVVLLNSVLSGAAWFASDKLQRVDNWEDLLPPKSEEGVETPDDTTVNVPQATPPDRGRDNTPPEAHGDEFGVRAGASTILPVLDNDSDADGDVLTIALPAKSPPGVDIQPINDGSALQIKVDEGVTSIPSFRYDVSDGRRDGEASASVAVAVHPESENAAPVLQEDLQVAVPVESGGTVTYNVLPDWIDPDGDDIYLESVTPLEGDTAKFTADGRVVYSALSGTTGLIEVPVTVSDGDKTMADFFRLQVTAAGTTPPIANADHLVVDAGEVGTVDPLANDLSASDAPLELVQVSEVKGASIVPEFTDGTFTFQSGQEGTYYVDYLVTTSGTEPVPGVVRVDVVKPEKTDAPPVAVRDVALLPSGGDALVNVLANDSDPAGGVLVVQSVEADPAGGLSVSVIGHETLRVTDRGMSAEGGHVEIGYMISNGVAEPVKGEVIVIALPKQAKQLPPVLNPDAAIVRVGDVVTIPVLENDYHPNDDEIDLVRELSDQQGVPGEAFTSENEVRFRAGDEPGQARVTYEAVDSTGQGSSSQVEIQVLPMDAENNSAPRPRDVEARALDGSKTTIRIPLDGIDQDGDSVELLGIVGAGPKLGTITEQKADSLTYEARAGVAGLDTFTYRVRDSLGAEGRATIRVGIATASDENQAPYAVQDELAMRPGRVVAAPVLENDSDPDGDLIGLVQGDGGLILGDDPLVEASVLDDRVEVTAPDTALQTTLQYRVQDERKAESLGVLQIKVDDEVPLEYPIARDDRVLIEDVDPADRTAEVEPLVNDEDPDGTARILEMELDSAAEGIRSTGDGTLQVEIQEKRRLIGYTVTDQDDQSTRAFIHVPGQQDLVPTLMSTEPVRVESGETREIRLADHVKTPTGKDVRLTQTDTVSAGHSDGSSLVIDPQTLVYTSAERYGGPDAITFEVTDGENADDPDGRVATLSIPIIVDPPANRAPEMSGASVRVGAGDEEAGTVELSGLATDLDNDPLSFELAGDPPEGLDAAIDGTRLSVTAGADQKGTVADIRVRVDDGEDNPLDPEPVVATIEVTVTASTREPPTATDDSYPEWDQGETLTADVLTNDYNPFKGEAPLEVVDAVLETGTARDAEVSYDADSVLVTPDPEYHGRLVVRYTVQDKTGDPDRTAQARVNVTVQGRPDAPGKPSASNVESREVTLSWDPPADNGAKITGYTVTAVKGGAYTKNCPTTTCRLDGLTNNVKYAFTVTAANTVGDSDPSPQSVEVRPDARPDTPLAPAVPGFGDGTLKVTWQRPATEGSPVKAYLLEIKPAPASGISRVRVESTAASVTREWGGLSNGVSYRFRVQAINDAPEPSDWSTWSAGSTPAKPPAAPSITSVTRSGSIGAEPGPVTVTWNAIVPPDDGGDAVDSYQLQVLKGGAAFKSISTTATTASVTLPVDQADYTFRVRAENKAPGWGAWGPQSGGLRSFTSPGAPGTPGVTPQDRQITASWTPATAGGTTDVRYQYSVNGGAWTDNGASTSVVIGGLQNGSEYRVAARAVAVANGEQSNPGPSSAQSAAAKPFGPPHAPSVSAQQAGARGKMIRWEWHKPGDNGRRIVALRIRIDGGGWQSRPLDGSEAVEYGWGSSHSIEAQAQDETGVWGAVGGPARASTAAEPRNPSGTVSNSGVNHGYGGNCGSGQCYYLQLNYQDLPGGSYSVSCYDRDSDANGFGTWNGPLSGNGSQRMNCYYGFRGHDVRLHVRGPGVDFWTPWWTWQQ